MKAPVEEIMKDYPLSVKSWKQISSKQKKGAWSVLTDRGEKLLKQSPASEARLRFLCGAVRHLIRNGAPVPAPVRARDGNDYVRHDGVCYTLSDFVRGRSPEYGSPGELRQIMRTMARFHQASKGYDGNGYEGEQSRIGRWEDDYRRHLEQLETFKETARKSTDRFSRLFLEHADPCISQGKTALRMIQSDAYRQWVTKAAREKVLCHQDFASGNLILNDGGLHVIDMDSLTCDLPARDLRKIFNKVMKKNGWNADQASAMLSAYQSVHPLSADEYGVLKADLLFPHLFYGIASKYYQNRMESEWGEGKPLQKLQMIIRSETSKMKLLTRWDEIAGKAVSKGRESA